MMKCEVGFRGAWLVAAFTLVALLYVRCPEARAAGGATTAHDDSVATILRDVSRSGTLHGLKWPRFPYYRDELDSLYSGLGWRPAWTVEGRPSSSARDAIEALRGAEERGLHPEDYDVALLERRLAELSSTKSPSARDVAWFDLALSVGFFRHVSDVHIGRVNPIHLPVDINVEPKKLDLARELRGALDRHRIAQMVTDAEPKFVQYRNLKAAYAHYRALAAVPNVPRIVAPEVVRPGGHFDGAQALRRRLAAEGDLPARDVVALHGADSTEYETITAGAIARFQERHGLDADSVLGPSTLAAINVPLATRKRQLELAMERIRWLPSFDAGPFVVVNVPSFQLYAFDALGATGVPTLTMNVVVGRDQVGRRTPLFERDMKYIVFRPYWVITRSIIRKETLPGIRKSSDYLAKNDMEIYSGSGDTGPALPATSGNIERVARGELGIRQRPGAKNSLGLAKFIFPNDNNVYMHGTPATELFARSRRDFSHGCIRLEDPVKFAVWVLRDPGKWPEAEVRRAMEVSHSRQVNLTRPLPVVIYYTTAVARPNGVVAFYDDVYRHDARLESALAKGYPFPP
jgi:L,D-transpeptidase YcbB